MNNKQLENNLLEEQNIDTNKENINDHDIQTDEKLPKKRGRPKKKIIEDVPKIEEKKKIITDIMQQRELILHLPITMNNLLF